jgi:long-chain acyl-CoA synthetase
VDRLQAALAPADPAILYLTSGATGQPKMALVSHHALVSNIEMGPAVLATSTEDSMLAFLPSAHITQRVVLELLPIRCGIPVWFSQGLLRLPEELRSVSPTIFVAPPRLWERVHDSIYLELRKRPPLIRKLFHAALAVGRKAVARRQQGRSPWLWQRLLLALAERFVFRQVRSRFGRRIRVCGSGSAPLGRELAEFYLAIGLPLVEGYGLTEGGVVTLNPLDRPRPGSVGKPLPGVQARVAEDGELLIASPTLFSGYLRDSPATAQALRAGWLHTGDTAEIDSEGYIFITGRKKDLIVASSGQKIFPSLLESHFHMEPIISHILLVGDRRPYVTALITVNTAVAEALEGMASYKGKPAEEIARAAPVLAEVERAVHRVNQRLAPFEQIRRYRVLDRDFTTEDGELTATLKLRRGRLLEKYRAEIQDLYSPKM